jgi:hypothetical protein
MKFGLGFLLCVYCSINVSAQKAVRLFEAQRISDQQIQLNWTTSAGITCQDLFIERSTNKIDFEEVYRHSGVCGSSDEEISYFWIDETPLPGISYYRLLESFGLYKDTVEVFNPSGNSEIFIFPNPASDWIKIYFNKNPLTPFQLTIWDKGGRIIQEKTLTDQSNILYINNLNDGLYFFQIQNAAEIFTRKILISGSSSK